MKNLTKFLILMLVATTLVGCGKIPTLENGEEAVATLSKGAVSANELYEVIKAKYGVTALVDLIDTIILEDKYEETDEEKEFIDEQVQGLKDSAESYSMTYNDLLNYYGFESDEEVREYFSLNYRRDLAVNDYVASTIKEKEIKKYYENEVYGEINVKHILIAPETLDGMTTEEKEEKEKEALKVAKEVIQKLKDGEDWDKLAKEYSDDTSNSEKGGDLGWIATGDTVAEFEDAAFALKKGKYTTSPVKSTYGYHIIYKVDTKEKPSYNDSKEDIIDTLVEEKLAEDSTLYYEALEEIRKESGLDITDSELKKDYKDYMNNLTTPQQTE